MTSMLALHALWRSDGRLAIWAEEAALWRRQPSTRVRRLAPEPHLWAVDPDRLTEVLSGVGPGLGWLARGAAQGQTSLLLPTCGGLPLPSPELAGPGWAQEVAAGSHVARTLTLWLVPCLLLGPEGAAQLLGELWNAPTGGLASRLDEAEVDVWLGATVRWFSRTHDLAWRTVHRGDILPTLVSGEARWVPVAAASDWAETRALAAAAPPAVRAESTPSHPEGHNTPDVLHAFLDVMVDAEARLALREAPPLVRPGRSTTTSSPAAAEEWLVALTARSAHVDADASALNVLAGRLRAWHRSPPAPAAPVRVCFRLVEPMGADDADPGGDASDQWALDLLLQPTAEPSILLAAKEVWAEGNGLAAVTRTAPGARELFAQELARAAQVFPVLRFALRAERPDQLSLDRAGALQFLEHAAGELAAAGFGILLPSWWGAPVSMGLSVSARAAQPGTVETTSLLDRDVVVEFDWKAAVGDVRLTERELQAMATSGQRLVRVRGQWMEVDPAQIAQAVEFLSREQGGSASVGELLRRVLAPEDSFARSTPLRISADGWLADLLSGAGEVRVADVAVPSWFGAVLRPYQQRGLDWLHLMSRLGLGAVLADDMGLGKTAQVLALLSVEKAGGAEGTTLVVCPMSLVGNWQRETARFAPELRVHVHHGGQRPDADGLAAVAAGVDVVVTTYGLVQRDSAALGAVTWRRVVLDEAQNVKNSASLQARAVRQLSAAHRVALTGTPVENRLADLHSVLDQANPGMFGTPAGFKARYSAPIERDGNAVALESLRRLTAPFVLRRLKNDPAIARELPDKQEMTVLCNLTAEQAGLYRGVVSDMLSKMAKRRGPARRGVVLSAITRLKQVCDHPALALGDGSVMAGRSGKVDRLEEILEEALAEGDKTLCFTQYAEFGHALLPYLSRRLDAGVLFLHGGTSRTARDEMVREFQTDAGPPVMLLSLRAGGTGLNLTAASSVIHLDRWWNPAVEDQATDRAFRIGQRKDVQVRRLVCVGTIEERIDTMIESKRELAGSVVGSTTGDADWLADLSTDAIAELVALSADAVSEQES